MQPDRTIISHLFLAGYAEGGTWLERHGAGVGRHATADLGAYARKASGPVIPTPEAHAPEQDQATAENLPPPRSAPVAGG
jgi:hypothetical protein